ncbi:VUT family protein [Parashewanella spongiae]|uniref:Queuosine precursor transporter n=1 Tax=Parashewanella spongiae TaxID=342950 RepID=A0A3A6U580_9GAMM|nr:queuosine precursor transporter [Parashewanella spongiae]MCL1077596.1 queuosine precursor transporter [Parashewanella spongiae]RJY13176.1 VUT family protein [Parashewanella spongiae]
MWQQSIPEEKITPQVKVNILSLLMSAYVLLLCLTVCFANFFITVFGMTLPGGIFVFPITFIICDVVGEVYGFSVARMFIWVGMISKLLFSSFAVLSLKSPHPEFFQHAAAYDTVFSPTLRYVISGMAGFFFGEFLNLYILSKWKIKVSGQFFALRSFCTTAIGQAILSIIVDFLAFYGKMTHSQLAWMMFSGWTVKMAYSLFFIMPAWMLVKHLKEHYKIDVFDVNTNFNPFRF